MNDFILNYQVARSDLLDQIKQSKDFDCLVVGGGIHGASFAHMAALNGLSVLLLEQNDYASATSSRSSKMLHGGFRYLETFDFRQVFEGIWAREEFFKTAQHLAQPHEFLLPVSKNSFFEKLKYRIGLGLYDLLLFNRARKHQWLDDHQLKSHFADHENLGFFKFYDGIMNDTRIVLENIIAARQEGAICLNYAKLEYLSESLGGRSKVKFKDCLSGVTYEKEVGVIVNCAGPWVPNAGRIVPSAFKSSIRYSRGSHLIFNKKWQGPALLLPLKEAGRYYFVWPHFAGTLVGTTEREVQQIVDDPQAEKDEINEILDNLARDLPHAGLDRDSLHYCFAGIRTLPVRRNGKASNPSSKLSRRHLWTFGNGILSLIGGKYTTAYWTAFEGLQHVFKMAEIHDKAVSLKGRKLPGAAMFQDSINEFQVIANQLKVPQEIQTRTIRQLGSRVRLFDPEKDDFEVVGNFLKGELNQALQIEQAENLEDIMRRRMGLEYEYGHGIDQIDSILKILAEQRPKINVEAEKAKYLQRMQQMRELLQ